MQSKTSRVWIVGDDVVVRSWLSGFLVSRGHEVLCLESGEEVLRRVSVLAPPSLILLDIGVPPPGGLELLSEFQKMNCHTPTIVLCEVIDTSTVVEAMRLGASHYVLKPIRERELDIAMAHVLAKSGEGLELSGPELETPFQSSNRRMLQIRTICDRVADADVPILILGESGVGKEVVARYIHERSGRRDPFVKVNCAALPTDLLESELFGHERGAFTGAQKEKPGKFELAGSGTIMLDEVAEMSPFMQAKLLHVLQDGEYSRLGGVQTLTSRARIIAATNKCLPTLVASGGFREDLYFRLNVIGVEIPPLRERREDIAPLCQRFVERYATKYGRRVKELPRELLEAFRDYSWPGNVRQLENAVKRFLILLDVKQAIAELGGRSVASPERPQNNPVGSFSLKETAASAAEQAERELIFQTLNKVNWNRKEAARQLKICYKSLLNKLHRYQRESGAAKDHVSKAIGAGGR